MALAPGLVGLVCVTVPPLFIVVVIPLLVLGVILPIRGASLMFQQIQSPLIKLLLVFITGVGFFVINFMLVVFAGCSNMGRIG